VTVFVSYTFSNHFLAYREVMATHRYNTHARYTAVVLMCHMDMKQIYRIVTISTTLIVQVEQWIRGVCVCSDNNF